MNVLYSKSYRFSVVQIYFSNSFFCIENECLHITNILCVNKIAVLFFLKKGQIFMIFAKYNEKKFIKFISYLIRFYLVSIHANFKFLRVLFSPFYKSASGLKNESQENTMNFFLFVRLSFGLYFRIYNKNSEKLLPFFTYFLILRKPVQLFMISIYLR